MKKDSQRLGVEIGGTFTDIMYVDNPNDIKEIRTLKVPSTPANPEIGVLKGVDELSLDWTTVNEVLHGSTVGTNAVLERQGVPTALLVTEGFRDILEIQRGDKENIYDIFYQRPQPLVPPNRVFPVRERMAFDGTILEELDTDQVALIASRLKEMGIVSVAISFLHSYANPAHEEQAKEVILKNAPGLLVLTSSELLPQFREYERTSTTVMSAYIAPIMTRYVESLRNELIARGFDGQILITQSNGGMLPAEAIQREVVRTLLSGPAAGVTGGIYAAGQVGFDNVITIDMGGTSTDVCLVNKGKPLVTTENKLSGLPSAVPMIDISSVGAGGGSIAWLDEGGMLRVGPRSAGADPGPACYDRGGQQVTVTDCDLWRGIIRPEKFAGGNYPLSRAASEKAIGALAAKLDMDNDLVAESVTKIAESNMMQAIRVVSTQRGHDPREYVLVAFGGAGPVHAVGLAEELGMEKVLIPRHAGILSAFGLLTADIARDYVQTKVSLTTDLTRAVIEDQLNELTRRAQLEFSQYGYDSRDIIFYPSCDARYYGQASELNLPLGEEMREPEEIAATFHKQHQQRYGFSSPKHIVEIVNYRLQAVVLRDKPVLKFDSTSLQPEFEFSPLLIDGKWVDCRFVDRSSLPLGYVVSGPIVIEEDTSTCYIPPGWRAEVLENGSILVNREE